MVSTNCGFTRRTWRSGRGLLASTGTGGPLVMNSSFVSPGGILQANSTGEPVAATGSVRRHAAGATTDTVAGAVPIAR